MARHHVRVQPGARRTGFIGWHGDIPKIAVTAPAVDGAANEVVIDALATLLGVRPRQVRLIGGGASRSKRLEIDELDPEELERRVVAQNPHPRR